MIRRRDVLVIAMALALGYCLLALCLHAAGVHIANSIRDLTSR